MTIAVSITDVVKKYGAVTALNGVSLGIRSNEFFTLLGPSGCGKTTLLRIIAGFETITAGELRLFGEPIAGLPPNKRPINTVFQHYSLFPHMTVAENVGFGLRRLGQSDAVIKDTVARMLSLVELGSYGDRKPTQLSGGQQQRVALARALAPSPKVLLLDEPLSALDLKLRQSMRQELKALQKQTGVTFIFVTHDQEEALAMSDRIAVMSHGTVQQIGEPKDIYETPATRFVADFIGDANFLQADVTGTSPGYADCTLPGGHRLIAANTGIGQPGKPVTLFLRPEKIAVFDTQQPDTLPATVLTAVYLGDATDYRLDLGNGLTVVARNENRVNGELVVQPGDQAWISVAPGACRTIVDDRGAA